MIFIENLATPIFSMVITALSHSLNSVAVLVAGAGAIAVLVVVST